MHETQQSSTLIKQVQRSRAWSSGSVSGEVMICLVTFYLLSTLSIWRSGCKAQQLFPCLGKTLSPETSMWIPLPPPWVCKPLLKTVGFYKKPLDFIRALTSVRAELQTPDKQKKGHLRGQELSKSHSIGSGTLSPF